MTPAAAHTADDLALAAGQPTWAIGTEDGGCRVGTTDGRYVGTVAPNGIADLRDVSGGEPGVPVKLMQDGRGEWALTVSEPT